jgi:thiazole synthase ThiGH ThiG subunit
MADFAVAYADQNDRDYEAFRTAVHAGRLTAQSGI